MYAFVQITNTLTLNFSCTSFPSKKRGNGNRVKENKFCVHFPHSKRRNFVKQVYYNKKWLGHENACDSNEQSDECFVNHFPSPSTRRFFIFNFSNTNANSRSCIENIFDENSFLNLKNKKNSKECMHRRTVIFMPSLFFSSIFFPNLFFPDIFFSKTFFSARANEISPKKISTPTGENFSEKFLRSIGIGDSDIYYPSFFEGKWICYSTLVDVEIPEGSPNFDTRSAEAAKKKIGFSDKYEAKFFDFKNRIINDRLFTTTSLIESTIGKNAIIGQTWSPNSPNLLKLTLKGGYKVQNLITKRSFNFDNSNQFETSEFSQQVFDNPNVMDGPPSIKASRNVTLYKWNSNEVIDQIEGFQKIYMFPVVSDLSISVKDSIDMVMNEKPVTIYKYRLLFQRVTE